MQSLIELAQRVRKARSWPRAEQIKESSLATYLGKFDAGEALEWLEQRPGALQALAEILEMTPEEARSSLLDKLGPLAPPSASTPLLLQPERLLRFLRQASRAGRPDTHDNRTRKELWQRLPWLHQMIAQRVPDWSKAWTLLEDLMPPAPV